MAGFVEKSQRATDKGAIVDLQNRLLEIKILA